MERELFSLLKRALGSIPAARRRPFKSSYTHRDVLAVALWAALHDRPISWAVRRENWPWHDRVRPLPSGATMSRRLRDPVVASILNEVLARLRRRGEGERSLIMDGRALVIANHSADPDAAFGYASGGKRNGYKLHAMCDALGNCRGFRVEPLKVSEQAVARDLLTRLKPGEACTLLADASYDSNELYEIAGRRGVQMFAERRYRHAKGVGHQRHSQHRLRALRLMKKDPTITHARRFIESCFGTQGNVVGGLGPLPNHVRRLHRVRLWVHLKLVIDAAHRWRRAEKAAA